MIVPIYNAPGGIGGGFRAVDSDLTFGCGGQGSCPSCSSSCQCPYDEQNCCLPDNDTESNNDAYVVGAGGGLVAWGAKFIGIYMGLGKRFIVPQ